MRNSTKNAIAAVVAIVLAVVIVIACGIGSSWFTNSDIATWFNSWGKGEQTEQTEEETPADEGGMQIGESAGSGISLMSAKIAAADFEEYGISPMAESAQQLTATITPANATNKAVDWSVRFKDANSAWANGKTVTDYVTVTPTSDGALTANVECKKAFGEQIEVVVTSRQNTQASATATVDYAKRLLGINRVEDGDTLYSLSSSGETHLVATNDALLGDSEFVLVYSDGTITDDFDITYTVSYSSQFISALQEQGFKTVSANTKIALPEDSTRDYFKGNVCGVGAITDNAYGVVMDSLFGVNGLYNKFGAACRSMGSNPIFTFEAVAEGEYSSATLKCAFTVSSASYNILVENVGFSGSVNLIF